MARSEVRPAARRVGDVAARAALISLYTQRQSCRADEGDIRAAIAMLQEARELRERNRRGLLNDRIACGHLLRG